MDVSWVADAWRPAHAWVGAWVASALYVGSLYLWPARYRAPRDHPAVIRRRTVSLLGTCVASCALPWVALQVAPPCAAARAAGVALPATVAEATGLAAAGAAPAAIASLCLCALLFLGPLARAALDEGAASVARLFTEALAPKSATAWRNHVVAPVAEEWVFRAVCVPTLVFAGAATVAQAVTLAPLLFGSAHVHHFFETRERMIAAEKRTFSFSRAADRIAPPPNGAPPRARCSPCPRSSRTRRCSARSRRFWCCEQATRARRRWRTRSATRRACPTSSPRRGAGTEPSSSRRTRWASSRSPRSWDHSRTR